MSTRNGALRQLGVSVHAAQPAAPARERRDRERRTTDAARRALSRWFGDGVHHAVVPGDK